MERTVFDGFGAEFLFFPRRDNARFGEFEEKSGG
jgi:hypothetical protein